MRYFRFGTGNRPFVILPGLSVHSIMGAEPLVREAYADYANAYTAYVFDREENIREGYSIRDMAADTAKKMKELGLAGADVFGASQGGMIAQYLAIDFPELVHKLVLGSTLAKGNDTFLRVVREWIALAGQRDEEGLLESFADHVYAGQTLDAYREDIISANRGITEEEYVRFEILAGACLDFSCLEELGQIACPVFVLGCEGDRVVTAEGSRQIVKALGCESYFYDTRFGHGVYDEAEDYRERMLTFLRR